MWWIRVDMYQLSPATDRLRRRLRRRFVVRTLNDRPDDIRRRSNATQEPLEHQPRWGRSQPAVRTLEGGTRRRTCGLEASRPEPPACLAVANVELNGPRPSETSDRHNPGVISDLAYSVSGLVVGLLQRHRRWSTSAKCPLAALEALRDAALRIGMAWDMVLAGDHDDLIGELEVEWDAAV